MKRERDKNKSCKEKGYRAWLDAPRAGCMTKSSVVIGWHVEPSRTTLAKVEFLSPSS